MNYTRYVWDVVGATLSGFVLITMYMLTHWLFAYKYWVLSFRVKSIFLNEADPDLKSQFRTNKAVIFNMFFWQILAAIAFIIDSFVLPNNLYITLLFFVSLWTQLLIDSFSCYVLWDKYDQSYE